MQEPQTPDDKTDEQDTQRQKGPSPGKAPFLLFVYLGLSLVLITLALLVFGPSQRMTDGRPAPAPPSAPAPRKDRAEAPAGDKAADRGFLYEEHLRGEETPEEELNGAFEARGSIARPAAPAIPAEPAQTPEKTAPQTSSLASSQASSQATSQAASQTASRMESDAPAAGTGAYKSVPSDRAIRPVAPPAEAAAPAGTAKSAAKSGESGDGRPVLALVIDDLGDSPAFANALLDLDFPVTLAVMPYRSRSKKVAELAVSRGAEVILHQPMEPLGYPGTDPGKGALFVGMSPGKIASILEQNLAQVPGADGINNHMGSRFTQDYDGMAEVMAALSKDRLFFLDSVTSPHGAAEAAAQKAGVPMVSRNVFLDNSRSPNAIAGQLEIAEKTAKSRGHAVAIGHPYKETLAALRWWASRRDPSVRMVYLRELPGLPD